MNQSGIENRPGEPGSEEILGFSLSPQQRRALWLKERTAGSAFWIQCTFRIEGPIELKALRHAVSRVVARYEVLRTVFVTTPAPAKQVIREYLAPHLRHLDLRSLDEEARAAAVDLAVSEAVREPFDLERGPLMRVSFLTLEPELSILEISLAAVCGDRSTLLRIVEEIARGVDPPDGEPEGEVLQYADMADWLNQLEESSEPWTREAAWPSRDAAELDALLLPFESPTASFRPGVIPVPLAPGALAGLEALAARRGASLAGVLQAAWHAVLGRLTGSREMVVGSSTDGRRYDELREAVGPLSKALPIRSRPAPAMPFFDLLAAVEAAIAEAIRIEESFSWEPLLGGREGRGYFPFAFELWEEPVPLRIGGTVWSLGQVSGGGERFTAALVCRHSAGALKAEVGYNEAVLSREEAERLAERFATFLSSLMATPEAPTGSLSMVGSKERLQLLGDWNETRSEDVEKWPVHRWFERQARTTAENTAVVAGGVRLTYSELDRRSNQLARFLRRSGVSPDVLVGLAVERSVAMVVGLLGVLKAGGAYLPLDLGHPRERLEMILTEARPAVVLTTMESLERLPVAAERRVCLDRDWERIAVESAEPVAAAVALENLAYVIYTSGSTGRPKGVMISHGGLRNYLLWATRAYGAGEGQGSPVHSPLGFDLTVTSLLSPLVAGGAVVLVEEASGVDGLLEVLRQGMDFGLVKLTPAHLSLVEQGLGVPFEGKVRTLVVGGEALFAESFAALRAEAPATRIINEYGPTETVVGCCTYEVPLEGAPPAGAVPIGRPIANTRLYLVDGWWNPVPRGVQGEIWIGGAGVGRGYLARPDLTAERFVPDPFSDEPGERVYVSGDLGRLGLDGNLVYLGRTDHQVKIHGYRIELQEIEAVLRRHPHVREAAVVVAGSGLDSRLLAFVVPSGEAVDQTALAAFLTLHLPSYMIPAQIGQIASLPLTENGKVDRGLLLAREAETAARRDFIAPRTPVEELLSGIWGDLLGVARVGVDDDFFELGGHSLLAMRLVSRIRSAFGARLSLGVVFSARTVSSLARAVEAERWRDLERGAGAITRAERDKPLPVSLQQRRLWILHQVNQGEMVYHIPYALRLAGDLDLESLRWAITRLSGRHESLRTTFGNLDGELVQIVADPMAVQCPCLDLSCLSEEDREVEARRRVREMMHRTFDLQTGPLLRILTLRLARQEHIVALSMHHIISDGWSMEIFVRELVTLYEAFRAGEGPRLPELPIQYGDYAAWQHRWLTGEVLDRHIDFWRRRLAEPLPQLELPTDRPRPEFPGLGGGTVAIAFDGGVYGDLRQLGQRQLATSFMLFLAAWNVLLNRYTGQEDILIGTPIAGRDHPEVEGLIGFFVNTLILRNDLTGEPTFIDLLDRVRDRALDAYAHDELPFDRLVEELQPERRSGQTPFFRVAFTLVNRPRVDVGFSGLKLGAFEIEVPISKFDLTLSCLEQEHQVLLEIEYRSDLYESSTALRMLGHLDVLLRAVAADPARPISELPMLTPSELRQAVGDWNATATKYPVGSCIHELFETQARRTPGRQAVVFGDRSLTYGELDERATGLAQGLRKLGVGPEVLVGLLMDRSIDMVVAMVGILKAGGAYLPLDPSYPRERLMLMLEDSGSPLVVTHQARLAEVPEGNWKTLSLEQDAGEGRGGAIFSGATPESLAYVIYTSGSTGVPKGVAVPHRAIVRLVRDTNYVTLTETDRIAQVSNSSFDAATFEIWGALANGAGFVIIEKDVALSPRDFAEVLRRERITTTFLTTALFQQIVREEPSAFATLREVLFGGEAVDPRWSRELLAGRPPERLLHVYGPTESTTFASWHLIEKVAEGARTIPIGLPLANTSIYVLERGFQPVAVGVAGELFIGSDGLARGYLFRPELTAARFVPDPFGPSGSRLYRTGDLVRRQPEGPIEFLSRVDHQVKLRGFRVELGEIETALLSHPAVGSAIVVVREDVPGEKSLVGYVVPKQQAGFDVRELKALLKQRLPEYMVPSALILLDALPLNANGKVDRAALPSPSEGREGKADGFVAPRTPVEEVLAILWGQALGVESIGVHEDFFDLGGNSLLATRLISRMRETFHVDVSVRRMFESPTISGIAQDLESDLRTGLIQAAPDLVAVPRTGELPLSFSQQRLWFLDQLLPEGNVYNISTAIWLEGVLKVAPLRRSLNEIVRRHEVLRSRFFSEQGRPVLAIEPSVDLPLPVVDFLAVPAARRHGEVQKMARWEAQRSFSLSQAPLLRVVYVHLGDGEQVLLMTVHHIVFDGWSAGIFFRELETLYRAFAAGRPSPLDELPIQYLDYAGWLRNWLAGEVLEQQLAYWRQQLAGAPSVLEMPLDRPRPGVQTFRGANRSANLPFLAARRLKALSREQGATSFMTMLAAFYALLHHYSGQDRIAVGTPIANRTRSETESLIGLFANTLVLCSWVDGRRSFHDLIAVVRDVAIGGYAHQDVPFEKLVDELHPQRDLAHQPLFQVMLVFEGQNQTGGGASAPSLNANVVDSSQGAAKFDMTLFLDEDGARLSGMLEYNVDLFDGTTAGRLLEHFGALLEGLAEDPHRSIAELSILSAAERHQTLMAWNDTSRVVSDERGLQQLFEERAASQPTATAVVFADRDLTYGGLEDQANRIARHLRSCGVQQGSLVAVYMERALEMIPALLGILKAGGAYVPLETSYPPARVEWILSTFDIGFMITQSALLPGVGALSLEALHDVLCLDPEGASAAMPQEYGFRVTADLSALSPTRIEGGAGAEDTAYIIFTSGSTGTPKGVWVRHRSVINLIDWVNREMNVGPHDRLLFLTSLCFDLSVYDIFGILAAGGSLRVGREEDVREPQRLLKILLEGGITFWDSAPAVLQQLVPYLDAMGPGEGGDTLRLVFLSGDWIPVTLPDRVRRVFPRGQVVALGGATEATVWSNYFPVGAVDPQWVSIPYGRPIQNARYYVLGPGLQPCPIGVPGDLYIGDECLCSVYAGDPALTADRFIPDPNGHRAGGRMYRTGDRARFRGDGNLQFLGRSDNQVKLRGFRIELGEIEATLRRHPGVGEALVVVREDSAGDRRLVAYLLPDPGQSADSSALRGFVKDQLPEYMVPSAFVHLAAFPMTPNGKVDRRALPAPGRIETRDERFLLPRDTVELKLVQLWEEILKVNPVHIDDDFFDLGGNSLVAVQLMARIRLDFQRDLPLATLFQSSTILQLGHVLRQQVEGASFSPLVAIQPLGRRPPLFCVHGIGGEVLSYLELARCLGRDQPVYGLQAPPPADLGAETVALEKAAGLYIEEIRTLQAQGPYQLAGYSYGAVLAFEMAQQLRRAGEQVALLGLIDGFSPLVARRGRSRSDVMMLASMAREVARRSGRDLNLTNESVETLPPDDAIGHILDLLLASDLLPPETDRDWIQRFLSGIKSREDSLAQYEPQVYDGEVTLFTSTEVDAETARVFIELGIDVHDPTRGWEALTSRPMRIFPLPGHHETILQAPHVAIMAEHFRTCLAPGAADRPAEV
ncbi:MAG: amino acid adenylation domain-containing protein [Acidobacteriota bacterium]